MNSTSYFADLADQEAKLADTRRRLANLIETSTGELGPGYVRNRDTIFAKRLFPRHDHPDRRSDGQSCGSVRVVYPFRQN